MLVWLRYGAVKALRPPDGENRCWCLVAWTSMSSTFHHLIPEDEVLWQHRSAVKPTYLDSRWLSELLLTASTVDVCQNTICLVLKNMPYSASAGSGVGVKRELWGVFVLVLSRRFLPCWKRNRKNMKKLMAREVMARFLDEYQWLGRLYGPITRARRHYF